MALSLITGQHPFWAMSLEEVFAVLESSGEGLTEGEVRRRQVIFDINLIKDRLRRTRWSIFINQFQNPLFVVLLTAGVMTVFLGEWIEAGVVFLAMLVNAFLGFWQEDKAENSLELLKTYLRTRARVRRMGIEREIDAEELVPGDVFRISRGDRVPADGRILFVNALEIDESALTGESLPTEKNVNQLPAATVLADRSSMVFAGTLAVEGFADVLVTATGNQTEFGKIAALVTGEKRDLTPLQKALNQFAIQATTILIVLTGILFGWGLFLGYQLLDMFLIAVAVAVAVVPEGLPIALTVILAVGVERLVKRKGVVRRLLAAETLGSTTLILTDKTGTLTEAKMRLTTISAVFGTDERELLRLALTNTDVVLENPRDSWQSWTLVGRPLETALVRGAAALDVLLPQLLIKTEIIGRLPFDSRRKFSATIFHYGEAAYVVVLGAPEILLQYTDLAVLEKEKILAEVQEHAAGGERLVAVLAKEISRDDREIKPDFTFQHILFRGLLGFRDPLRSSVREALADIKERGVRTIIVTGDHRGTAEAVARSLALIDGKGAILTGDDLNYLKREELWTRADEAAVYARVTPEQKEMLVNLYQEKGEVVALTGDGVNDAPALEAADVGVALGSGTDVAKSAADLVLLDDRFETVVAAIEEGRRIMGNIRRVVVYLLSGSLDELLLIGGSFLVGLSLPINALQILFVNFFSDSFPAIALGFEKEVDGFGGAGGQSKNIIFDRQVKFFVLVLGFLSSLLLFLLYFGLASRFAVSLETVKTFIFSSFATYTLFLSFSLRSLRRSIFSYNPFSNLYLVVGVVVGLILTLMVVYLPFLQDVFGTVALSSGWLAAVFVFGFFNIGLVELGKWSYRKFFDWSE